MFVEFVADISLNRADQTNLIVKNQYALGSYTSDVELTPLCPDVDDLVPVVDDLQGDASMGGPND